MKMQSIVLLTHILSLNCRISKVTSVPPDPEFSPFALLYMMIFHFFPRHKIVMTPWSPETHPPYTSPNYVVTLVSQTGFLNLFHR